MKRMLIPTVVCLLLFSGCGAEKQVEQMEQNAYTQITAAEAKVMMDEREGYILLDVRTQEEYNEGHIEGAVLIPDTEIKDRAENELPDKQTIIFVYCRTGRRSKLAAQDLVDMGYVNVYELGGILEWPYEIVL